MERFIPVYLDYKVVDDVIYVPEKSIRYVELDRDTGDMYAAVKDVPYSQYPKRVVENGIVANGAHQIKMAMALTGERLRKAAENNAEHPEGL